MAYLFRTRDKDGRQHPKWRFQYTDWQGRRRTGTAYTSKTETAKLAAKIQREHDEIRKGYRTAPKSSSKHKARPFAEVAAEYQSWGESKGGRGGRPWDVKHAGNRKAALAWWRERLSLEALGDVEGVLPRAEKALRELQNAGRAGKTLNGYKEALATFCRWCVTQGYLSENPLRGMTAFDTTPKSERCAMTPDEIRKLLDVTPKHRRPLYEVAFTTGLRVNELRCLKTSDLDERRGGLILHAEWTKNRKPGFQPLPLELVTRLKAFVESGQAREIYETCFGKGSGRPERIPKEPLLYVPSHTARDLYKDLASAGLPKYKPGEGKIDFHAARVAYATMVDEAGATEKQAQSLVRHEKPTLTYGRYVKARESRLGEIAEAVGEAVLSARTVPESIISTQRLAAGAESYCPTKGYNIAAVGLEPTTRGL